MELFPDIVGARFSACRTYRYALWRIWDERRPPACFIMLNPSMADESRDDATVARCVERARRGGFGGLLVANLFALRSTDPARLYRHPDPVGAENDAAILDSAVRAGIVICGWGEHGKLLDRADEVRDLLAGVGIQAMALRVNASGEPAHPLYLPYDLEPTSLTKASIAAAP